MTPPRKIKRSRIRRFPQPWPRALNKPFSTSEVTRILTTVHPKYRNYLLVYFFTGMRASEIHGLRRRDLDFENRTISIGGGGQACSATTCNHQVSPRVIPMLRPVYEALLNQCAISPQSGDRVFCNDGGKPLNPLRVTREIWHPLLQALELIPRPLSAIRFTTRTLLADSGDSEVWVEYYLGLQSSAYSLYANGRGAPPSARTEAAFLRLLELPGEIDSSESSV